MLRCPGWGAVFARMMRGFTVTAVSAAVRFRGVVDVNDEWPK
jgi:hypothetical protein